MRIWRYLAPVAAVAALRGLAAAQPVALPTQSAPRLRMPVISVPAIGFPRRFPHRGAPTVRLPQVGLPKPLTPRFPSVTLPLVRAVPVAAAPDVRAAAVAQALRRRSLGPGLKDADLAKAFDTGEKKAPEAVPAADPASEPIEPALPEPSEGRPGKPVTLPEWDLENEIGLP